MGLVPQLQAKDQCFHGVSEFSGSRLKLYSAWLTSHSLKLKVNLTAIISYTRSSADADNALDANEAVPNT